MTSQSAVSSAAAARPAAVHPLPYQAPRVLSSYELLRWMFRFLVPVKGLAALSCLYLALAVGGEVLAVRQTGQAVNHIRHLHVGGESTRIGFWAWITSAQAEATRLRDTVLILLLLLLGLLLLRYLREVTNARFSMQMVYYMREAVYDKLQRVGFRFHDANSSGQLINRALSDLQHVRAFVNTALLTSLEIVLIVGGYIILLLTRSPWVAALSLLPLPVWIIYIVRFGKKVRPATLAVMEAEDRNVARITENIAGVHVVKAFATQPQEIDKYNQQCDDFFARVMKRVRMYTDFTPIMRSIAMASHLSLFLATGILMIKGKLDAGDFLILGSAMSAILSRLQQIATINEQYQNAVVSGRRLFEVIAAVPAVAENPLPKSLPPGAGSVRFENVTFGYDPAKPVLRDVSFAIPGGSTVALVGPTGAGKTTLVNLLGRFYDPQRGRLLIDGIDVRDLRLSELRRQVGYVFQETYLFSDTVEANIAYGRPGVRGGVVEAAARLAQAHEFITALPQGYQTMLGERGASLSGGQRQRLAIARAILFNPRVLILDDATAAVDPETEDLIQRGMNLVMQDRTVFLIAHRVSTAKRADLVVVLEDGRVTQIGTHDQLMERDGHYRYIAAVQLYGDDGGRDGEERPSHMDRMHDPRRDARASPPLGVHETQEAHEP